MGDVFGKCQSQDIRSPNQPTQMLMERLILQA